MASHSGSPKGSQKGSSNLPMAYLDHTVVMLDDQAHQELLASELVRQQLGRFKIKTATSSLANTYESAGLAGARTLMEFFHVAAPPLPSLVGAVVLSFPQPGSLQKIRPLLETRLEHGIDYQMVTRTLVEDEEPRPWYQLIRPNLGENSPFLLMLAEVTADYFEHLGASSGPGGELHRHNYLTAALGSDHRPDYYLGDVSEVTINLEAQRAEILGTALVTLGYTAESNGVGICYRGPDITLRVVSSTTLREGIIAIATSLQRPKAAPIDYRFGTTTKLSFGSPNTGVWSFEPPLPHAPLQPSSGLATAAQSETSPASEA